jgi:hypothetical protein
MENRSLQDAFGANYFRWAARQAVKERDRGFPHLRTFPTGAPPRFLSFYGQLSGDDKEAAPVALAKRWAPEPHKCFGGGLSVQELRIVSEYQSFSASATVAEQARERGIADGRIVKLKRRLLSREVRKRMDTLFAGRGEGWGPGVHAYIKTFGNAELTTIVDLGGNFHDLSYSHSLRRGKTTPIGEHISLLSYLGLSSMTIWADLSEDDIAPVSECVLDLVRDFLESVPELLQGLP